MLILNRGNNVYYSFLDLTTRDEGSVSSDFYKALLPITSEKGLLNVLQDVNNSAILKSEYGAYKSKYVDYSLQTAEEITKVGSNVLVSRISSGKEGYKVIDLYIDENNSDISSTLPTFKTAKATSEYSKGEDVFSEGISDYTVDYNDKSDKPDLYVVNGIDVGSEYAEESTKYKYLMSIQSFKPVNFDEFTVKVGKINSRNKATISENSYLTDEIIDNKFIKIEIYNQYSALVETFIGAIESGYLDINDSEFYIEDIVNLQSDYIFITGLTTETTDITTGNIEAITDTDSVYFTNNTEIEYDVLFKNGEKTGKVMNDKYNNKKILLNETLDESYLEAGEYVYEDFDMDDEAGYVNNAGLKTDYDDNTDYFVVKERCNSFKATRVNTVDLKSKVIDSFKVSINKADNSIVTVAKDADTVGATVKNTKSELSFVFNDIIYNNSLITKADYVVNSNSETLESSTLLVDAILNQPLVSGSVVVNSVTKQVTFNDVLFNIAGGTDTIVNASIENETRDSIKILSTKDTTSVEFNKLLINGVAKYIETANIEAVTTVASNVITVADATKYTVGEEVTFDGVTLPSEITSGVVYYILTASGTSITISSTIGGTELTITDGTYDFNVNTSDYVINLLTNNEVTSTLTVKLVGADEVISNDVEIVEMGDTVTDIKTYYDFILRNYYDNELNTEVTPYDEDGLNSIYEAGGALNLLNSKEIDFFFLLDAVIKNTGIWETYQASLNSIAKTRKDCIAVLFGKKFTLGDITEANDDFDDSGVLDVNGLTRFADYGNEFSTMLGMWYDDVLEGGQKVKVPSLGYYIGRWLLGLYGDRGLIVAGTDSPVSSFDKELMVSVDEDMWDLIDKLKINIPVKIKGHGNVMWFKNTTYNKASDLRELQNMFILVYLIRTYYPILITYIHKRYIDKLTGTNYVVKMKNQMLEVLNQPKVNASFAKDPEIDLISTEEELENGIIVWSHKLYFSKTMKAVEVKFTFEKTGSIYLDLLQNV